MRLHPSLVRAMERKYLYFTLQVLRMLLVYWQWQPITTLVGKRKHYSSSILTGIFFSSWVYWLYFSTL